MAKKVFFFHYNKPQSQKAGRNILTVHYGGSCHFVHGVEINVPIVSKDNKSQPRCVMKGYCSEMKIVNNIAVIK